jgi:predicted MFS family arabinose efflux permease
VSSAASLAAIVGAPLLALVGGTAGWRWATALLLLPVLVALVGSGLLPAPTPGQAVRRGLLADFGARYRAVLLNRPAVLLLGSALAAMCACGGLTLCRGAAAVTTCDAGERLVGGLYLAFGLAFTVGSNAIPRLLARVPIGRVYNTGAAVFGVALLAGSVAGAAWQLIPVSLAAGVAFAALWVPTTIMLLDASADMSGTVLGLLSAVVEVGVAAGAGLGGAALSATGGYAAVFRALIIALPIAALLVTLGKAATRPATAVEPALALDLPE